MNLSIARTLMIVSLVLLGVLEYMWLRNEYGNKYRAMESQLNHVMYNSFRDVEDSLIFARLENFSPRVEIDSATGAPQSILININDSIEIKQDCRGGQRIETNQVKFRSRNPMRGIMLQQLAQDSVLNSQPSRTISAMVKGHIRLMDSTGEYAGYQLINWRAEDTLVKGVKSRSFHDILAGQQMALINPDYKVDIAKALIPHAGFALFLWIMVGAAFYYIWRNLQKQIQLNALRDEFISNITHELKTPITTVGVALESLGMSTELNNSNNKRLLDIGRSELKRLSLLVEKILQSRAPQAHYEKIDIRQVLEDVMHHMKVQFENKHAVVDVKEEGEVFLINGDRSHMSGVFYNLLENALKYSREVPEIHVRLRRSNGTIRLDIKDNGIGIEQGYHDKIFEKLFRVPQNGKHDVKGHGLGLSYVADVVKQHKGKIDLTSEPGKGSTFSLTLPAWHEN